MNHHDHASEIPPAVAAAVGVHRRPGGDRGRNDMGFQCVYTGDSSRRHGGGSVRNDMGWLCYDFNCITVSASSRLIIATSKRTV